MHAQVLPQYKSIYFVGAGGTGGYTIPNALRMFSNMIKKDTAIHIYDQDRVEEHNCERQNFVWADIGKYKSQVLGERYSSAFGVPIKWLPVNFTKEYFNNLFDSMSTNEMIETFPILIVDTVDSRLARSEINDIVKDNDIDWISAGNTENTGQIIYYSKNFPERRTIVDLFPDEFTEEALAVEREEQNRANCGLNVVRKPQTLAINLLGATLITNILYQIFYEGKIDYDVIIYNRNNMIQRIPFGKNPFEIKMTAQDKNRLTKKLAALAAS